MQSCWGLCRYQVPVNTKEVRINCILGLATNTVLLDEICINEVGVVHDTNLMLMSVQDEVIAAIFKEV